MEPLAGYFHTNPVMVIKCIGGRWEERRTGKGQRKHVSAIPILFVLSVWTAHHIWLGLKSKILYLMSQ